MNGDQAVTATFAPRPIASPVALTLAYVGDDFIPAGTTGAMLEAQLTGPAACVGNQSIAFAYDQGSGSYSPVGTGTTNGSGLASFLWVNPPAGLIDLEVSFAGSSTCSAVVTTASIVVASSSDSSNGGGWYRPQGTSGDRCRPRRTS